MTQQQPRHSYEDIFTLFFHPGEVAEIRAFGCSGKGPWEGWAKGNGTVSGYFNDPFEFAKAAKALESVKPPGIYFTINPVMPDFLSRAANRLKVAKKTTDNENVHILRWLFVDFDPIRAGGGKDLNTNQEEFDRAWKLRNRFHEDIRKGRLAKKGVPAISGNGAHLLLRLPDLQNSEENNFKLRSALLGIRAHWGDPLVDIDSKTFNPARICKLYGTTARKSDHTEQRPQRISYVQFDGETCPILADIPVNDRILDHLVKLAPEDTPKKQPPNVLPMQRPAKKTGQRRQYDNDLGPLKVGEYLNHYGISYKQKPGTAKGYTLYVLDKCIFNPDHGIDASISQASGGTIYYQCFHDGCEGRTWHDARTAISGTANLAQFMEGYDPNLKPRPPQPPPYGAAPRPSAGGQPQAAAVAYSIDSIDFIRVNSKGREALDPAAAADYFEAMLQPIYCTGGEKMLFWQYHQCGVWRPYSTGKLRRLIRDVLAEKAKPSWIKQIVEMLEFQCYKDEDEISADPMYINLINGMWGIKEREILPHDHKYNSKLQLNVSYDEDADADLWLETLLGIFKDDELKIDTLQDFIGYCFFPRILFPGVLFAIGDGGNGKGVIEHAINKLFGSSAIAHTSLKDMNEPWGPYELYGKYVNTVSETSPEKCDMTGFKAISAGDPISAKIKYQVHPFTFSPFAKHYISMNQLPYMAEKTRSVFRRITVLEFEQNFTGKDADPYLKEKLEDQLDGIFLWALDGLYRVLENKCFTTPESVARAKERFKYKASPILTFAQELCVIDKNATVSPPALFKRYRQWCDESGVKSQLGKTNFYEEVKLTFKAHRVRPEGSTIELFKGIGLAATERECEC